MKGSTKEFRHRLAAKIDSIMRSPPYPYRKDLTIQVGEWKERLSLSEIWFSPTLFYGVKVESDHDLEDGKARIVVNVYGIEHIEEV